jgi:hypothetical protein
MELPSIATGVEVIHEGLLRATLNDIGWYAKKNNLSADQVRRFFEAGIATNHCLIGSREDSNPKPQPDAHLD